MSSVSASSPPQPLPPPYRVGPEDLPRPMTSFIGRQPEIDAIFALLMREDVRMVTVNGPGGIGKTRLALQVARRVSDVINNIWFVALASIRDTAQILPAIARSIGMVRITGTSIDQALITKLNVPSGLLILDNTEQLPGAGEVIARLLNDCPNLTILVTSRASLRIAGEHVFSVPPMGVPSNDATQRPCDLERSDAVRLFLERAQARNTGFSLTDRNALAVASICRELDGLPLAIELAAARIDSFSPQTLSKRLAERLTLLSGGPCDEVPRLRSMRDSIAWSYALLRDDEQSVFDQLAVFAGPWTLESAEAVVETEPDRGHRSVLECVIALIQHNLIGQESDPGDVSFYVMLETIRQFAGEKLSAREDQEGVRDRHAALIRGLAEQAEIAQYTSDGAHLFVQLRVQFADIQQALAWMERRGDIEDLIHTCSGLRLFWGMQGNTGEGRPWLERSVMLGRATDSPNLGLALVALATTVHMQGDEALAWKYADEGRRLLGTHDTVLSRFASLTTCGLISLRLEHFEQAASLQKVALDLIPTLTPARWVTCAESTVLGHLGNIAVSQGQIEEALDYFDRALARQAALGPVRGTSHFLANHPIAGLGDVARARGEPGHALRLYQEALDLAERFADLRAALYALGGVAGSLACTGDWLTAATLFGACDYHHRRVGFHFSLETMDRQRALGLPEPWQRADHSFGANQQLRNAVAKLNPRSLPPLSNPEAAAHAWSSSREMSLEDAVAVALVATAVSVPGSPLGNLTARERDVLFLVAQGKTDQEIGSILSISRRTASTHVRHIYDKLDVSSRAAATAYALRHGLA